VNPIFQPQMTRITRIIYFADKQIKREKEKNLCHLRHLRLKNEGGIFK